MEREDTFTVTTICTTCGGHLQCPTCQPDFQRPLDAQIREAATTMHPKEARLLVKDYYIMQSNRVRADNQIRSSKALDEPTSILEWSSHNFRELENQVRKVLDSYSSSSKIGEWAKSNVGIGPVIASGLLAHIDLDKARTPGAIFRFAGLDPSMQWLGRDGTRDIVTDVLGTQRDPDDDDLDLIADRLNRSPSNLRELIRAHMEDEAERNNRKTVSDEITRDDVIKAASRRPFNANLKRLCWIMGESFIKVSGNDKAFYGQKYAERKLWEIENNEAGGNEKLAGDKIASGKFKKATKAKSAYEKGRLPDAEITSRSRRWAVKMFLSHYWDVAYRIANEGQQPPRPWVIEHGGHTKYVLPPNLDMI